MKKKIMSILDKRTNRLSRLNKHRKFTCLTTENSVGGFEIEVSPKALEKLKNIGKDIRFSFEHDFGVEDKNKEKYWVRVSSEYPNKRTDFNYFANGKIEARQHSGVDDWGVKIVFNHIDVSCNWGQLNALCEMLAKYIDQTHGEDCGFEDRWRVEVMKIDFIRNKI